MAFVEHALGTVYKKKNMAPWLAAFTVMWKIYMQASSCSKAWHT